MKKLTAVSITLPPAGQAIRLNSICAAPIKVEPTLSVDVPADEFVDIRRRRLT